MKKPRMSAMLMTVAASAILLLAARAATAPSFVTDEAVFWLDAAAADTLSVNENGEVTSWASRVGSNYARQSSHGSVTFGYPAYDTTSYGIPTVDLSSFDAKTLVNTYILAWDAQPANSVKFVPDASTMQRGYAFAKMDEGLKLISAGFTIFVR